MPPLFPFASQHSGRGREINAAAGDPHATWSVHTVTALWPEQLAIKAYKDKFHVQDFMMTRLNIRISPVDANVAFVL